MRIKPNYIVIPLITVLVALLGGYFTSLGMPWYDTVIIKPSITPPDWIFPIAWNIIFVLTTISVIISWNKGESKTHFLRIFRRDREAKNYNLVIVLFILNAILNILWTYLFFGMHLINFAFVEMLLLEATLLFLVLFTHRISPLASVLLLPYTLWVAFATCLTYQILLLNF